jgi:energy-coupling factor transporter ATP-binding protein EcfA2
MGFTLDVENFGCLAKARWQPDGVCALVGPNGAGKTTLLQALSFLSVFEREGLGAAALSVGSMGSLKRFGSPPSEGIRLRAELDGCAWEVRLAVANGIAEMPTAEDVFVDGAHVLNQPHGANKGTYRVPGGDEVTFGRSPSNAHRSALALAFEMYPEKVETRLGVLASTLASYCRHDYEHLATPSARSSAPSANAPRSAGSRSSWRRTRPPC